MKKITFIPAKNSLKNTEKLKVAAYCRVSTECESQQSSLDLQIRYYTDLIQTNPEWEFSGVFYDYESGLRKEKRNGLDAVLQKAYCEEIDYIITKSVSKLSRNVLDTLTIIQSLKVKGINIYFEKDKDICPYSPTLDEKWAHKVLGEKICENGVYDEEVVRNKVDRILVFSKNLEIRCKDESKLSVKPLQKKT